MRVVFLAESPCALFVNGVHLGIVDGFERVCELEPKERVFCELKPNGKSPVSFFFDEEFLLSPPPHIKLYYYEGGVAVFAGEFLSADLAMSVLWQKRLDGTLLTLYRQGRLQLNLENDTGFHMAELPDSFEESEAYPLRGGFLIESKTAFALLTHSGEIVTVSEGRVLERERSLKAEVPFHDSRRHVALCEWTDGKLTGCNIRTTQEPTEATFALALFESVLIGADYTAFLHESLLDKADALREFLGAFESVVLTDQPNKAGLVYMRKERVYDVRYFRVEITDSLISNIKPV